jgi:hypothetical protein
MASRKLVRDLFLSRQPLFLRLTSKQVIFKENLSLSFILYCVLIAIFCGFRVSIWCGRFQAGDYRCYQIMGARIMATVGSVSSMNSPTKLKEKLTGKFLVFFS